MLIMATIGRGGEASESRWQLTPPGQPTSQYSSYTASLPFMLYIINHTLTVMRATYTSIGVCCLRCS